MSPEAPLSGTLSRGITGSLRAGVTVHMDGGVACFEHLSIDDTFEGDGSATCSDEPDNEIPITWTPTAC